jgi:hypothetical protein
VRIRYWFEAFGALPPVFVGSGVAPSTRVTFFSAAVRSPFVGASVMSPGAYTLGVAFGSA